MVPVLPGPSVPMQKGQQLDSLLPVHTAETGHEVVAGHVDAHQVNALLTNEHP